MGEGVGGASTAGEGVGGVSTAGIGGGASWAAGLASGPVDHRQHSCLSHTTISRG